MSNDINFDNNPNRADTDSVKWNRYSQDDILPLWVADMDFAVAPAITEALRRRLEHPVFGYGHVPTALNDVVVDRMQQLYHWLIQPEWLVWLPGVVPGLHVACQSIGDSQSVVFSPDVVYPHLSESIELSGRQRRNVPLVSKNQRWIMDMDWLAQQRDPNNKALILCNPHNPGGSVYSRAELMDLAEVAQQQNLIIISDEVHSELILEPGLRHIPIASLDDAVADRTITLMASSKTFNLAGLGCSFAIIPNRQLRRQFNQRREGIVSYVNIMGYVATQAAYSQGHGWHQQLLDYLRNNRDYLMAEINQIEGLALGPIEASYLAWIDVSELKLDDPHRFFEQAGVGMSPGREFGSRQFMRLNFGCSKSILSDAVARMRTAVNQHMGD